MISTPRHPRLAAALFASFIVLAGCVPRAINVNTNAGVDANALPGSGSAVFDVAPPGRVGILEAEVFLYDVSAGGVLEFRDDWSRDASGQAARSAALTLKRMEHNPLILPDPARSRDIFRLKTRLRYHCNAFQSEFFSERRLAFGAGDTITYSIGPIDALCDLYGVNAFLYIYGFEEKLSPERRQLLSESGGEAQLAGERTFIAVIMAERGGRITWYKHILASGDMDMRTEKHSLRMMGALLD